MSLRPVFNASNVSNRAVAAIQQNQSDLLKEISTAIEHNPVVVVGMAMNPFVKKARKTLEKLGTPFTYLEYGNYFNKYDERVAIKMWTGWPTFPQVFVKGTFIGGADDLNAEIADGSFQRRLAK
jgi:monothiol glutaredoxin